MKLSISSTLFRPSTLPFLNNTNSTIKNPKKCNLPSSSLMIKCQQSTAQISLNLMGKKNRKKGLEDLSDDLYAKLVGVNLDHAPARRQLRSAFVDFHSQLDHVLFKFASPGIRTEEWYEVNSKGQEIFCKSWLPNEGEKIKGAVCFCHGYGDTCTFLFEGIARRIAGSGYAVYAVDHPGFGLSDGLHGYISRFDDLVDNVIEHFSKIKDEMLPPEAVLKVANLLSNVLPDVKFFQTKDLAELVFRNLLKYRKMAYYNMICYSDRVRLKTAMELLKATREIESNAQKTVSSSVMKQCAFKLPHRVEVSFEGGISTRSRLHVAGHGRIVLGYAGMGRFWEMNNFKKGDRLLLQIICGEGRTVKTIVARRVQDQRSWEEIIIEHYCVN